VSFAIDVNILLYASFPENPFHERATAFLDACVNEREVFCLGWPTVMGYLRIATNPAAFENPLTPVEAMGNIESLMRLTHARFLSELDGFWDTYRGLAAEVTVRGNLVPDAHLAVILCQHGIKKLYTHDRDFLKFNFLDVRDPLV
jgi:hypothetical protein